jgi:GYF domain 2
MGLHQLGDTVFVDADIGSSYCSRACAEQNAAAWSAVPQANAGNGIASRRPSELSSSEASSAEWYVIHGGNELGPLSLAGLVGKAALGEIEADDLVRLTGGKWVKARDVDLLQQQFYLKRSREEKNPGDRIHSAEQNSARPSPSADCERR